MAGDWIKLEHATADKPEVLRAADMLGISREAVLGFLFRYWVWLDKNLSRSCPDSVPNVSAKSLDSVLQCEGFAATLEAIGWAKFDANAWTLTVVHAERHNGNSAKTRALAQQKKRRQRADSVPILSPSKRDKNGTREEKRREELNGSAVSRLLPYVGINPDDTPLEGKNPTGKALRDAAKRVLECLNRNAGRRYEPVDSNLNPVLARFAEGYSERELCAIAAVKARQWRGDEKMEQYIRPKTLYTATNAAQYRAELPANQIEGDE